MARTVYAFPPVGVVGHMWTEEAPLSVSHSLFTDTAYTSSQKPVRRRAKIDVSSLANGRSGAGYMEVLIRLLAGGQNLVRLNSRPINRFADALAENPSRQSVLVEITDGGSPVSITDGGSAVDLYDGHLLTCTVTTDGGFPAIFVSGFAPFQLAARPGEFVTVFEDAADTVGETVMVMAEATAGGAGNAMVRVLSAPSHGGRVCLGVSDTAVFRALSMPQVKQPRGGDWSYSWDFVEVFSAEVGGFTEVNPWT